LLQTWNSVQSLPRSSLIYRRSISPSPRCKTANRGQTYLRLRDRLAATCHG
jgi:hypothetical protein